MIPCRRLPDVISCGLLLLACLPALPAASALRSAGEAVREADEEDDNDDHDASQRDERDHHDHHHASHAHDHGGSSFAADVVVGMFVGLRMVSIPAYQHHPYDKLDFEGSHLEWNQTPVWNGNLSLLGGAGDDELTWLGGEVRGMTPIGLGIGSQWLHYREEVDDETVEADLADVSLAWRMFELPQVMLDVDLGWLGWHDEVGTENGIHIGTRLTVFPLRPLVLSAAASAGAIDEAGVQRYHLAAGAVWEHWSLELGYRWVDIDEVDLDGWELRASFWF